MKKTTTYQFNLIEGKDSFLPTPLNQNMEKAEAALLDLQGQIDGGLQVAFGSYTGTGTFGSATPNTLEFPFKPLLLMVVCPGFTSQGYIPWLRGATTAWSSPEGGTVGLTWGENSVSWWDGTVADFQLNVEGHTYNYLALGVKEA